MIQYIYFPCSILCCSSSLSLSWQGCWRLSIITVCAWISLNAVFYHLLTCICIKQCCLLPASHTSFSMKFTKHFPYVSVTCYYLYCERTVYYFDHFNRLVWILSPFQQLLFVLLFLNVFYVMFCALFSLLRTNTLYAGVYSSLDFSALVLVWGNCQWRLEKRECQITSDYDVMTEVRKPGCVTVCPSIVSQKTVNSSDWYLMKLVLYLIFFLLVENF